MNLKKVKLCRFRAFNEEVEVDLDDLTAIIGANSSGKTSFFYALSKIFGENGQDREIKKSDFYFPNNINLDTINNQDFYIETIFTFDEINNEDGIKHYSIPNFLESFVIDSETNIPYVRIRMEAFWTKSNQPEGVIEKKIFFVTSNTNEIEEKDKHQVSKEILSKIKFVYVPAVRDPYSQLKNVAGSILWRLLNGINMSDNFKNKINDKINEVNDEINVHNGIKKISDFAGEQWKSYHTDKRYENIKFIFNTSDIDSILKKIEPSFTPTETGNAYRIEDIGDGLKSLFYFSLVGTLLKVEEETIKDILNNPEKEKDDRIFNIEPPYITIMGVEEPENHISPYILGKVICNLQKVSKNINSQVIISSHSPSIVKRISPENIRYFNYSKDNLSTRINKIVLPVNDEKAFKYVKEAIQAYPELYFANLVILGEGDSEEVVIPKVLEVNNIDIISHEIAIVPLGGRHVNHFWKLLNQLEIPHITLLDLDLERGGGGFGRIKYAIEQLIENGHSYDELLKLEDGTILDKKDFKEMHLWDNNEYLRVWIDFLKEYNVYFSEPIDLDFSMLKNFEMEYRSILDEDQGPEITIDNKKVYINKITDNEINTDEYNKKLEDAIHATLKSSGKSGENYNNDEKRLMIWYQYFFLYRGKPVIHRLAINKIEEGDLISKMPATFKDMSDKIKDMLAIGE